MQRYKRLPRYKPLLTLSISSTVLPRAFRSSALCLISVLSSSRNWLACKNNTYSSSVDPNPPHPHLPPLTLTLILTLNLNLTLNLTLMLTSTLTFFLTIGQQHAPLDAEHILEPLHLLVQAMETDILRSFEQNRKEYTTACVEADCPATLSCETRHMLANEWFTIHKLDLPLVNTTQCGVGSSIGGTNEWLAMRQRLSLATRRARYFLHEAAASLVQAVVWCMYWSVRLRWKAIKGETHKIESNTRYLILSLSSPSCENDITHNEMSIMRMLMP